MERDSLKKSEQRFCAQMLPCQDSSSVSLSIWDIAGSVEARTQMPVSESMRTDRLFMASMISSFCIPDDPFAVSESDKQTNLDSAPPAEQYDLPICRAAGVSDKFVVRVEMLLKSLPISVRRFAVAEHLRIMVTAASKDEAFTKELAKDPCFLLLYEPCQRTVFFVEEVDANSPRAELSVQPNEHRSQAAIRVRQ